MRRKISGRTARPRFAVAALPFVLVPALLRAGTTGKISGQVLDRQERPIVAVTVAVVGQPFGAFTSTTGQFNVLNVPPGVYEVRVTRVGFKPTVIQNVVVSADNTTKLDVHLDEAGITTETVIVSAERPPVEVNLTSSIATVRSQEIEALPVQELQDIVNLQAGVVDGHFRGGRLGEVQYQIDGVSANNAYDNSMSLRLDRSLLQEVQVISGTFDAEYGQAMSGVVNAILKDGTNRFHWDVEAFTGGFLFPGNSDARRTDYDFRPVDIRNFTVTASGPLGLPSTTFLANIRRYNFEDYVYGRRVYGVVPDRVFSPAVNDTISVASRGDGSETPLGYNREWSGAFKFTNRSLDHVNLSYQAIYNHIESRSTNYAFRYNPDGMTAQRTGVLCHGIDGTFTLGNASYLEVALRQNYLDYKDMVYDDAFDRRYDAAGPPQPDPGTPGLFIWGVDFNRFEQMTNNYLLKSTYVRQISQVQQLKTGAELQIPEVRFGTPGTLVYSGTQGGNVQLTRTNEPGVDTYWPVFGSAFVQDQVEWPDLTLRAGLRLDYFDARSYLPSDLRNPANAIMGMGIPQSVPQRTSRKVTLAPRLGVAYPITERAGVHFAYGHFYQYPAIGNIFANADYSRLENLQSGTSRFDVVFGNPDIEPEKSVQYEMGYKQALTLDFGYEITAFYKDIRNLRGVEFIITYNDASYARLANVDFGDVLGVTFALDHRKLGPASLSLDYTWQTGQGNTSDPIETAARADAGEDARPRVSPFNWDQRNTLNLTLAFEQSDRWSASAIVQAATGQPYTPEVESGFSGGLENNSGRKPVSAVVDLRAERIFRWSRRRASVFGRIFNLFDARFFNGNVYTSTGSPYYSRFGIRDEATLRDPTWFYPPRRIEIGMTLRSGQ